MGLKDKAKRFRDEAGFFAGADQAADTSDQGFQNENLLDKFRRNGYVDSEDLLRNSANPLSDILPRYLLSEDDITSTLPASSEYSIQSRVESLINLVEICKEIAAIDDPADLWESLLFNIIGQVGAREAAIFMKTNNRMILKTTRGYFIDGNFLLSKKSGIQRVLDKQKNILYVEQVYEQLSGEELEWLRSLNPELIIPITRYQDLKGFILLGKNLGGNEYGIEDLVYLKLLGEIIGSFSGTIEKIDYIHTQKKIWEEKERLYQKFHYFQNLLQTSKNQNAASEVFREYLEEIFQFHNYIFFFREKNDKFSIVSSKGFHIKNEKKKSIKVREPWLLNVSASHDWIELNEVINEPSFSSILEREDLVLIKNTLVLPLHFSGMLHGFFMLFNTKSLPQEDMYILSRTHISTYFWHLLGTRYYSLSGEKQIFSLMDPLENIRNEIDELEQNLKKIGQPFSVYIVKISNMERLTTLLGSTGAKEIKMEVVKLLKRLLPSNSRFIEIPVDMFVILVPELQSEVVWKKDKDLHKKLQNAYRDDKSFPLIQSRVHSRPESRMRDIEELVRF